MPSAPDPGNYVYPVDFNVAPTSKLNAVTTRSLVLKVRLDGVGNTLGCLAVTWENRIQASDGARRRDRMRSLFRRPPPIAARLS